MWFKFYFFAPGDSPYSILTARNAPADARGIRSQAKEEQPSANRESMNDMWFGPIMRQLNMSPFFFSPWCVFVTKKKREKCAAG